MKYAIGIVLFVAVVTAADEAISSQSNTAESLSSHSLTASASAPKSSVSDGRQQNKRLAYIGSASNTGGVGAGALSSGFKPIITSSSYPVAQQKQQQHSSPYTSSVSSAFAKHSSPYSGPYVPTSNVKHSSQFVRGLSSHGYQPQLTYSASQPTPVSHIHSPFQLAQQIYAHQMPSAAHYNHVHQAPYLGYPNTHHFSYSNQYQSLAPQPIQRIPIHNQGQPFTAPKQQLITSKPSVLETPLPPTTSSSASEVHHNLNGAVSYVNFSQHPHLPTPAALIATPPSHHHQHVYYQQPQAFYPADYNKPFHPLTFAQLPSFVAATNYFPNHHHHHHQHQQQQFAASAVQPYAHISKLPGIPTASSAQVASANVIPNHLQRISYY